MEGGFCSQINYMALGLYFKNKNYKVKYDLEWYEIRSKSDNKHVRNFEILDAFPNIDFELAEKEEAEFYKNNYKYANINSVSECTPPAYVSGFPKERIIQAHQKDYFIEHLNPTDKEQVHDIKEKILSSKSCAVHVRRGDLSVYNPAYGYPTPVEYYIKALKIIKGLSSDVCFYFFSDECDWVENELIPKIDFKINYQICNRNGSDKGYLDLYLMTNCDYLISSSGSLAKFAKILSRKNPMIIMDRYSSFVANFYENVLILNDTILINQKKGIK
jgi:hypothetical protein